MKEVTVLSNAPVNGSLVRSYVSDILEGESAIAEPLSDPRLDPLTQAVILCITTACEYAPISGYVCYDCGQVTVGPVGPLPQSCSAHKILAISVSH